MATYQPNKLKGSGSLTEELTGVKTFTFHSSTIGSSYFTFETVRTAEGVYDNTSTTNAVGTYDAFSDTSIALTSASIEFNVAVFDPSGSFKVNNITLAFTGSTSPVNTSTTIYIITGSSPNNSVISASDAFNFSSSLSPYVATLQNISSSYDGSNITLTYTGSNGLTGNLQTITSGSSTSSFAGGTNFDSYTAVPLNGLVTSSYIFAVVIPPGTSSFNFTPSTTVAASSSWLRGTGEFTLTIT